MKPPKPRIAKPRLKWTYNAAKGIWDPYHRTTWTENGKRRERAILLKWEGDAQILDRLYWECQSGRHEKQKPAAPARSWKHLVQLWRSDPREQKKLAASTKASYNRYMEVLLEKNADKPVASLTRQRLRLIHDALSDTPRKADWIVQIVRKLWNYAQARHDWPLATNPAENFELYGKQSSFDPWPEWMVDALTTAPQNVRTTAEIILGTGQRPSAAIEMRWNDFNGEWVTVMDDKTDTSFEIFAPQQLRTYLKELRKAGRHIMAKNIKEPLGYDAVQKQFSVWRKGLGPKAKPFVLHGLRKLAITRLAEAGCTDAEIQAVTNQSLEMVAYYRQKANRKTMSKNAAERNTNRT
ncbi:MAG: tyrosine-type recombinase/integrase [Pseudoruegeria sp.]